MKKSELLKELKKKKELQLVEPSDEICFSYLEKSDESKKAAVLLFENRFYNDSISSAYYSIYNALTGLLFKTGIKSENHTASIILLKLIYKENELADEIFKSKEIRENAQYFITTQKIKESSMKIIQKAEELILKLKLIIKNLNNSKIEQVREEFKKL